MADRLLIDGMDLKSLLTDGIAGEGVAEDSDSAFKTVVRRSPQKSYGYTRLKVAVTVPANSTQSVTLRNMGNIGLISNPTIDSDDVSLYSVSGNVIADSIPTPAIGGEFARSARLNRNYQTGNLPDIGVLRRVMPFPGSVDQVWHQVVMDSDGNIYFRYTDTGANRKNTKLDRNYDTVWDVADEVYDGKIANAPFLALSDNYLFLLGASSWPYPYVYNRSDGGWANDGMTLYAHAEGNGLWLTDGNFLYYKKASSNDWWKGNLLTADQVNTLSGGTKNPVDSTMSLYGGKAYFTDADGHVYEGQWDASVTKIIDDFTIAAQDEDGTFYGWNASTGNFESYDVSGNLLWSKSRTDLGINTHTVTTGPNSIAVDETNDRIHIVTGITTEIRLLTIDRTDGSILKANQKVNDAACGVTDSTRSVLCDRYGKIAILYYTSFALAQQDLMRLYLWDYDSESRYYSLEEGANYKYKMQQYGLEQCSPYTSFCTGWKRLVWGNYSTDAANVGGLYILE